MKFIKSKKPWGRIMPPNGMQLLGRKPYFGNNEPEDIDESPMYVLRTQADFLRELDPNGHNINSEEYYPNVWRTETVEVTDDSGTPLLDASGNTIIKTNRYCEYVPRFAFAFQRTILIKQLTHLCGGDIQFDYTIKNPSKQEQDSLTNLHVGWLKKDMEIAFYQLAKSSKAVGDGAFVGYFQNGKFLWQTLSFEKGDKLYPHYDHQGNLILFARAFNDYDEESESVIPFLEVWDSTYLYRLKQGSSVPRGTASRQDSSQQSSAEPLSIQGYLIDGYTLISQDPHNFPFLPIAYKRNEEGSCWSPAQDSIDSYEMAFSQMAHNNQLYGEPIMYLQGESVETVHDMNGTLRMLTMGTDDKAGYLESQSASDSYMKQLELLYNLIYEQCFAVIPPKISGNSDISGAAIKILYSPAIEKAMTDAADYQQVLNDMVKIFAYGYGVECQQSIDFTNLPIKAWIKPFIFENESAIVNDLVQATAAGFCSKQTASERIPFYNNNDEWDRIIQEQKEAQQSDLLYQIQSQQAQQSQQTQTQQTRTPPAE